MTENNHLSSPDKLPRHDKEAAVEAAATRKQVLPNALGRIQVAYVAAMGNTPNLVENNAYQQPAPVQPVYQPEIAPSQPAQTNQVVSMDAWRQTHATPETAAAAQAAPSGQNARVYDFPVQQDNILANEPDAPAQDDYMAALAYEDMESTQQSYPDDQVRRIDAARDLVWGAHDDNNQGMVA